jgi:hypothetical protein
LENLESGYIIEIAWMNHEISSLPENISPQQTTSPPNPFRAWTVNRLQKRVSQDKDATRKKPENALQKAVTTDGQVKGRPVDKTRNTWLYEKFF